MFSARVAFSQDLSQYRGYSLESTGQAWKVGRLNAVAGYAAWASEHEASR